jgi:hypothetical protein
VQLLEEPSVEEPAYVKEPREDLAVLMVGRNRKPVTLADSRAVAF